MNKTELRIHMWPERTLKKRCRRVTKIDNKTRLLLEEMLALMVKYDGLGLAANQVGVDARLVVARFEDKVFKLVNPRILKKEGKTRIIEGCLSFPGLELEINRSKKVWVDAQNERGEPLTIEAEGILSVIFQHELDHIDGIPFIYRIPLWQRIKIFPKLDKIKKIAKSGLPK